MLTLVLVLLLLPFSLQDEPGIFYNPPTGGPIHEYQDDPVYEMGQTVQLLWATTQKTYSLVLWQNNYGYEWIQTNMSGITSFDWIVNTNSNLSLSNVFFFQMRDGADPVNGPYFASHYFNITPSSTSSSAKTTTSTSSISTPSVVLPSPTSTKPAAVSATSTGSPTPTAQPSQGGGGGLSEETKIGLGLGLGLGIGFSIALACVVWYFRRQSAKLRSTANAMYGPAAAAAPPPHYPYYYESKNAPVRAPPPLVEAPGIEPGPYELQS